MLFFGSDSFKILQSLTWLLLAKGASLGEAQVFLGAEIELVQELRLSALKEKLMMYRPDK